jgi:hypothetical protein
MALVAQLLSPALLLGDFNAHHTLWGCNSINAKGEEVAGNNPALYLDFSFTVKNDSCGSSHFPVTLKAVSPNPACDMQRWKLRRADWNAFNAVCVKELRCTFFFFFFWVPTIHWSSSLLNWST